MEKKEMITILVAASQFVPCESEIYEDMLEVIKELEKRQVKLNDI